jgi:serine/threonine-protein kinase
MGAVYLARDLTLDREVAIKVIKTEADTEEVYDRFRREARTAAALSHPNIVPLHAFGEVEGMPYFVMGYVRGESLATRLRRDGRLPEDEARRILAEVADALDHAHRQGVVHRDVKPDNVLLDDESGRASLTDFGVAKAVGRGDTLTRAGSVIGTPLYMSPEQAAGRADIDGRADLYALGVMGYAMLAGRLPFEGSTQAEVLTKHLTQDPPPLRSLTGSVSDPTVQAIERCLAKDPARRFADARSLKLALGVAEEPQLPDTQRAVQGQGMLAAYIVMLELVLVAQVEWPALLIASADLFGLVYVAATVLLMREGLSLGQSQRAIWADPGWWPLWYPRGLRRPDSVWDRLPAAVRRVRALPVVVAVLTLFYVLLANFLIAPNWRRIPPPVHLALFAVILVGGAAMLVLWYVLMLRARRELQGKGLDPVDARRVMLTVPPARTSFWARPHIAAILGPAPRPEPERRADTPHDQLQSILRHGNELSGPLRPLGAQAALAARQLLASIEQADRDAAELARNLEPGEEERLGDKIAALAAVPGREDEYAPLRALLEKQLELVHGLSGRIAETRAARGRRAEMLKTLALHVASLRARSAQTPAELASLSERVRTLCDDIARQAQPLPAVGSSTAAEIAQMATLDRGPGGAARRP